MNFSVDQAIIDIFCYLKFSAHNKEKIKTFQEFHSVKVEKFCNIPCAVWRLSLIHTCRGS